MEIFKEVLSIVPKVSENKEEICKDVLLEENED